MSTSKYFKLLITRNKTSSPEEFEFMRFDCTCNDNILLSCRFIEKGNLEIMLFTLQSKMRAHNQRAYLPAEGKLISDINKAWDRLEKAEHERELALREELIRYQGIL